LPFAFLHARQSGTRSGKAIGRPKGAGYDVDAIKSALRTGLEVAKESGANVGTAKGLFWAVKASRLLKHIPAPQRTLKHEEGKGGANAETLSTNLA
jgi:hypothetical protein